MSMYTVLVRVVDKVGMVLKAMSKVLHMLVTPHGEVVTLLLEFTRIVKLAAEHTWGVRPKMPSDTSTKKRFHIPVFLSDDVITEHKPVLNESKRFFDTYQLVENSSLRE